MIRSAIGFAMWSGGVNEMSLEEVKIGDWVWMSERKRRAPAEQVRPFQVTETSLHTLRISPRTIDEFRKRDGSCVAGPSPYFISAVASNSEVAAWEADAEAAEAERQRAEQERHNRNVEILQMLGVLFTLTIRDGLVVGFERDGHRYEIREID